MVVVVVVSRCCGCCFCRCWRWWCWWRYCKRRRRGEDIMTINILKIYCTSKQRYRNSCTGTRIQTHTETHSPAYSHTRTHAHTYTRTHVHMHTRTGHHGREFINRRLFRRHRIKAVDIQRHLIERHSMSCHCHVSPQLSA